MTGVPGRENSRHVQQLHAAAIVFDQRPQAAPYPQIDACLLVARVDAVHVVALLVRHHLQGQLVMVPQEQRPLAITRNGGRLLQDVHDGKALFHAQGHEHARHQREMESHLAFVALAEIRHRVLGPLVGLRQQHPLLAVAGLDMRADALEQRVGGGQVLAVGAFRLEQVGHRVQAQAVHAQIHPEVQDLEHGLFHRRILEIEIGLMGIEPMPEIRLGERIPGPIGGLEILEDDARFGIAIHGIAPHVEIPFRRARRRAARALEPGMLVGTYGS